MPTVRELTTKWGFTVNDKQLKRADSTVKKLRGNMKALGVASVAAIAGLTITFKRFVDASRLQQTVTKQTEAVIKSTGGAAGITAKEIAKMSAEFQRVTNVGDEVVQSGANMLLTFTKIGKDIFPDATEIMLDMATAMNNGVTPGMSMLRQTAIQLGKALNDPVIGATALRRVGVNLTEQQIEQIKVFTESGDLMSAQRLILNELKVEFGGSARAQVNSLEQLGNAWGDVKEVLGDVIQEALVPIARWFLKLKDRFDALSPGTRRMIAIITVLTITLVALLPVILLLVAGLSFLFSPIGLVIIGIGVLIALFFKFKSVVGKIMESVRKSWGDTFGSIIDWISNTISAIKNFVPRAIAGFKDFFVQLAKLITDSPVFKFFKFLFGLSPMGLAMKAFSKLREGRQAIQRTPENAPTTNNQQTNIRIESPINVTVPSGNPEEVAKATREGVEEGVTNAMGKALRQNRPAFVF